MDINMKMFSIVAIALFAGMMIAACDAASNDAKVNQYVNQNGVSDVALGSTYNVEALATEKNQQQLDTAVPIPYLTNSLERQNIARRLNLLNNQDKMFYIYLVNYGKVMAFYTAKGKVSSCDSQITVPQQIVANPDCLSRAYSGSATGCYQVVDSPQQDGSYGTNGNCVYFFTTDGAYVEWRGDYMSSDFPLKLSTPPEMVREVQ
jgi:hypothetical protein